MMMQSRKKASKTHVAAEGTKHHPSKCQHSSLCFYSSWKLIVTAVKNSSGVIMAIKRKTLATFLAFGPLFFPQGGAFSPLAKSAAATRLYSTAEDATSFKAPDKEIDRRRNLAIISHPDSGKTTMTEKLLLYGGALQQAGAVRQKAEQRATQSDFMEMEKERGISISSTVMNFDYNGLRVNILDTPGESSRV